MKLRSRNFCVTNVSCMNISDNRIMTYFLLKKKKNRILIEFKNIFLLLLCFIVFMFYCYYVNFIKFDKKKLKIILLKLYYLIYIDYFILFYFFFKNSFFSNAKYFNEISIKLIENIIIKNIN